MVTLNCTFIERIPQKFSFLCSTEIKNNSIWVWNAMKVYKHWQNLHFWVNYSFKQKKTQLSPNMTVNWKLVSFVFFQVHLLQGWLSECCETLCKRVKKTKTGRKGLNKRGHAAGGSCVVFHIPTCCCFWICNALWRKEQTVSRAQRRPGETLWKEHTAMEDNSEPPWPPPISAWQPKVMCYRTSPSTVQSGSRVCACLNTSYAAI